MKGKIFIIVAYISIIIAALCLGGDYVLSQDSVMDSLRTMEEFQDAVALSIDPSGTIYVLDRGTNEIIVLRDGKMILRSGGFGWNKDGFDSPYDITAPNGLDIYVADYGNHRIVRLDRTLALIAQIPSANALQNMDRQVGYPRSVAVSQFGKIFILDGENGQLAKMRENNSIDRVIGGVGAGKGRLIKPVKVRISKKDNIYVQDQNTIVMYDIFGNYIRTIGESIFHNLHSFTVTDSNLVAVDSCRIFIMNNQGVTKNSMPLEDVIGICVDIRDVFISDKQYFLLTAHKLYRTNILDN